MKKLFLLFLCLMILFSHNVFAASTSPHLPSFAFTFSDPVPHTIHQGYLYGEYKSADRGHTGVDFRCPTGTEVRAAKGGDVIVAGSNPSGYGEYIIINHGSLDGNNVYTLYAHLSQKIITSGRVEEGEVIGLSGNTGKSTGAHLHFEVRYKKNDYGSVINPEMVLKDSIYNGYWGASYGYVYDSSTTYSISAVRISGTGFDKPPSIESGINFGAAYTYLPMTSNGLKARDIYDFDINYLTGQLNATEFSITLKYEKIGYTTKYESSSVWCEQAMVEIIPMN